MTKMTKRFGAAALAVLGMMVSTGYCKDAMEEVRAGTAGFETGMDIKEMISAQPLELAAPQPEAVVPAAAAARDIFTEIKACNAVDRVFAKRPTTEEALRMLAPCMKGVKKLYGNNVYAEATIMDPDNLQIVVLDSVAGKTIVADLEAALAKRNGGLFCHKVTLSVMDVSHVSAQVGEYLPVGERGQLSGPAPAPEFTNAADCYRDARHAGLNDSQARELCRGSHGGNAADCYRDARSAGLNDSQARELCRGGSSGAVDCYRDARHAGLNDSQARELCRGSYSSSPVDCYRDARNSGLNDSQAMELCRH